MYEKLEEPELLLARERHPPLLQPLRPVLQRAQDKTVRGLEKVRKLRFSALKVFYRFAVKLERKGVDFLGLAEDIRREMEWLGGKRLSEGHEEDYLEDEEMNEDEEMKEKEDDDQEKGETLQEERKSEKKYTSIEEFIREEGFDVWLNARKELYQKVEEELRHCGDGITSKDMEIEWERAVNELEGILTTNEERIREPTEKRRADGEDIPATTPAAIDRVFAEYNMCRILLDKVRAEIKDRVK